MRARPLFIGLAAALTCLRLATPLVRADPLEAGFRNPPDSAKPQTWWHWMNGNITREGITADLEAMKRVGIGGAQIFNVDPGIPAGRVKFLSPEWRDLMSYAVREASRLGLELGIHNGAGWSSSGGPWNTPALAMQRLTASETNVVGPRHFAAVLPQPMTELNYYRDVAVVAFRERPGEGDGGRPTVTGSPRSRPDRWPQLVEPAAPLVIEDLPAKAGFDGRFVDFAPPAGKPAAGTVVEHSDIVDLTARLAPDGRLEWDVPAGNWTIIRGGYTPTGEQNHPAPVEGTGLECDKLSPAALDAHWAGFVQKVLDDAGPLAGAGQTLENVLIDSYEVGGQNWTPRFRVEFAQRRGYDPLVYAPVLAGHVVDSPAISERFLWDMRRTIADLFADNYYGHFQKLCHEHGLQAVFEPYTGPFDSMQCGARADLPMGEFWVGGPPDPSVKLASSIGHVYGKPIIGAESFTGGPAPTHGRWLDDPYSLKTLGDLVFCQGVNRYIFHRYALQPWTNRWPGMTMGPWGTHLDRTITWWEQGRAWMQYIARCQFLLQQGKSVADAAYFCGENAPVELRAGNPALPPGHDWDAVNTDVLLHHATVRNGSLVLDSGTEYRVLILPPSDPDMRPELLRQLHDFVAAGLTVVGARPDISPSLQDYPRCDLQVNQLASEMWGPCDGGRVTQHACGRGQVFWGRPMARVFDALGCGPDFEVVSNDTATLAFNHRRDGDAEIYFVSNQRRQSETVECAFRVAGKAPELWNPETGDMAPAPSWREQGGRTFVSLSLDPAGSVFVLFRAHPPGDHLTAVRCNAPSPAPAAAKTPDLRIVKALYGAASAGTVDVTGGVKSLVAGGTRAIRAGNDLAGEDPAPGIVKRLRVEFMLRASRQVMTAPEGSTVELPEGVQVTHALYGDLPGVGEPTWIDVTGKIKALIRGGSTRIHSGNDLAGRDPAPNIGKQLVVEYRVKGGRRSGETDEGRDWNVPAGVDIISARYGRPEVRPPAAGRVMDLTAKLDGMIRGGRLSVTADNRLAGGDPAPMTVKDLRVDYRLDGKLGHAVVQEGEMLNLPEAGEGTEFRQPFEFVTGPDGRARLLAWAPMHFDFAWSSGRTTATDSKAVPAPLSVSGPWQVSFPPGWNAPDTIILDRLQSWTESTNPGVKYFSGTAVYRKEIEIPAPFVAAGREIWLDLGQVRNFAEVTVNGQPLGLLWKPPFRVNISPAARAGVNRVEIKVTNLWPNRLIGDEQLPADSEWNGQQLRAWPQWLLEGKPSPTGRVTFTTWHHWKKDDPLLESGLLGPVTLRVAEEINWQ